MRVPETQDDERVRCMGKERGACLLLVKLMGLPGLCRAQVAHVGYDRCTPLPNTDHPLDDSEHLARSTSSWPTMANCLTSALLANQPSYVPPHDPWAVTLSVYKLDRSSVIVVHDVRRRD